MDEVFKKANLSQGISAFNSALEFPYGEAQSILNRAIDDLNDLGSFKFMYQSTALAYSAGVYTYDLNTLGINPNKIHFIEKQASNKWGELEPYNLRDFRRLFRKSAIQTTEPSAYTDYNDTLELNTIPDQDYSIKVWHYKEIERVSMGSDVLVIPKRNESVLYKMAMAHLLDTLSRPDANEKYQEAIVFSKKLVAAEYKRADKPSLMPGNF